MDSLSTGSLAQLSAAALVVLAVYLLFRMNESSGKTQVRVAEVTSEAMSKSIEASTVAFTEGIRTLKDGQEGQRIFFENKVNEMHKETEALMDRIHNLELENAKLIRENAEKTKRISELEKEVDVLRTRMNGKGKVPVRRKPDAK